LFGSHGRIKLITVGSLEEFYKGTDVLIDALANCVRSGVDIRLTILGDGRRRAMLEAKTIALGLSNHVSFLGHLPAGTPVRGQLDQADLFVLPSRQEGLPRAMIEAMARGLPCIGSAVGGIPELLPAEDLVPPGDAMALAAKIREVIADPERMARMSARNLAKAAEYREDVLRERRVAFYRYLREQTEAWIKLRGG
jgi:glycosyltransferase involved in cell wall biosynthesis